MNGKMKIICSMFLVILFTFSVTACEKNTNPAASGEPSQTDSQVNTEPSDTEPSDTEPSDTEPSDTEASVTEAPDPLANAGKTTPCTDDEISEVINAGNLLFNEEWVRGLIGDQKYLPEDVLTCLYEHLGEYKVFKMDGDPVNRNLTDEDIVTIAAVIQIHGYTPENLLAANSAPLSKEELSKRVEANKQPASINSEFYLH